MNEPPCCDKTAVFFASAFSPSSPLTYSLYLAIPYLRAAGWRCVIVAKSAEVPAGAEVRFLHELKFPWSRRFESLGTSLMAGKLRREMPQAIFVGLQGFPFDADLTIIHFTHGERLKKQTEIGFPSFRMAAQFLIHGTRRLLEKLHFELNAQGQYAAVSQSSADYLRQELPGATISVLPNCYDPMRFNLPHRLEVREAERKNLGMHAQDLIFAFLSQGHYERKGFWRAVAALKQLREQWKFPPFRIQLLVIGGLTATLDRLRRRLDQSAPGWKEWIIFTGSTPTPENPLSAADAFLFPSYYEGFSLAEIEAAALGLPLFVTEHGGSEMILRDGKNGLLLANDPSLMAEQLADYLQGRSGLGDFNIDQRRAAGFCPSVGEALAPAAYAERLAQILTEVKASRCDKERQG